MEVSVPAAPPLARINRVELIHTGRWPISTGVWNASRADLTAAVAALDCPAVRKPVLKLGHSPGNESLWAGNPTGEPAIGWVDNLSLANGGQTLVGDFVGMPGWFAQIAPSAFPDRSVEGAYDFKCQIGHTHPFVLTAVALLGVTPPGVGTLRSLQDVGTLYGVTSSGTRVMARFDPDQPRWPAGAPGGAGGQWRDQTPNPRLDRLNLTGRARMPAGERFSASAAVTAADGTVIPAATVDTPSGPRLRLGTGITADDRRSWRAANLGATVSLDQGGVAQLRDALAQMRTAGEQLRQRGRELHNRQRHLRARRQDLTRRRHGLTRAEGAELARLDEQIPQLRSRVETLNGRIRERVARMSPQAQAAYSAAATEAAREKAIHDWHEAQPQWAGVGVAGMHRRDVAELARLGTELTHLATRRGELTSRQVDLPAERHELEQVTADLDAVTSEIGTTLGSTVASGVIPSADPGWPALVWSVDVVDDLLPDVWIGAAMGDNTPEHTSTLNPGQMRRLGSVLDELAPSTVAATATAGGAGLTLADSEVELDLWDDASLTLGWDDHQIRIDPDQAEQLVAALNDVRGDATTATTTVTTSDGPMEITGGGEGIILVSGPAQVLLSDDDAYDLQLQIITWAGGGVEARAWDPAKHPRWPAGTPGGLGGRFMPKDLVPRLSGATRSRSTPRRRADRQTPPTRAQLQSATSEAAARTMLQGLTVAQLRQVARDAGLAPRSRARKADLVDAIVQGTVGVRLDHQALSTPATGELPDDLPDRLRGAQTPQQARQMLQGLSTRQLEEVAQQVGAEVTNRFSLSTLIKDIIEALFQVVRDITAAAKVHTGAMVALIPAEEDLARLAVPGGEPADQLHTTLVYLGEAAALGEQFRQRLVDELAEVAALIPAGEADGMALAAFNPQPDRDTAIVLEVGGDGLEDVHGIVTAAVEEVAAEQGVELPVQHAPWRPHVTLLYSQDIMNVPRLADRAGPVRYDRLRIAFAGQHVDLPLTGEPADDPDLDQVTDDDMPIVDDGDLVEVVAQQSRRVSRSDRPLRRYWLRGAGAAKIRWNTPGDFTRCVRQLRKYVRDPKGLCAVYHRQATGVWPGDRRNVGRKNASTADVVAFDPYQPRDKQGRWTETMHLATPGEIDAFKARFGKSIPPAWTDVHIADDLDTAPLLVHGIDSKGRPQSIYSAAHTQGQAAKKFARVQALSKHLDKLDFAIERDAATDDDAAALMLIRRLGMRPGSTHDTHAAKQAYGATTLLARHVRVTNGVARFDFTGKKVVRIRLQTRDQLIVDALSSRLATRSGNQRLFNTSDAHVRAYMHSTGVPSEFLLKDLRTVHANAVALKAIRARRRGPTTKREFRQWRAEVAKKVAAALGNTPAVALSSYINPTVFGQWAKEPDWVAAAAEAVVTRDEERELLAGWFATVTFDRMEAGIPPVEPDPDDEDDDGHNQEGMTLPNPNPTIVHAAAGVSVDDVREAYYRQAPQHVWIREFHTRPLRLIVANDVDGTTAKVDVRIGSDGQIRFSPPVPVRVEYVEADVDESRMVYASAAESRPVVAHLRGQHNQKSHGRRYNTPGDPTSGLRGKTGGGGSSSNGGSSTDSAIRDAYGSLVRGEGASIPPSELDGLLRSLTGGGDEAKRANLAQLDVHGYGTLFATDKDGALDRSKMPQLGTNEQEMRPFLDLLRDRGVGVSIAEIDPTTLKPSQSEISGAKTGKLYGFMAKDGWLPGGLLVTSNDGYVVDGHHRWSGAAAVRASGVRPDMTVTGLVVDRPIDEVLQLAASVASFESLDFDRDAPVAAARYRHPAGPEEPTDEEDIMFLNAVRQRLGLAGDADEASVLAALDKTLGLNDEVQLLRGQVETLSGQVAAAAAERRDALKREVLDAAQQAGKFTPADRARWENDFDRAPEVVTRVLASIADGTAVPVAPVGSVGSPPGAEDDLPPEPDGLFSKP